MEPVVIYIDEAAQILNTSTEALYSLAKRNSKLIPKPSKFGGRVAWLRESFLKAADSFESRKLELKALSKERTKERRRAYVAHKTNLRRATKKQRTPLWADKNQIRRVYAECRKATRESGMPHHVDHIIPLQGKRVSGLHVAENLRVIPATENLIKSNRFQP